MDRSADRQESNYDEPDRNREDLAQSLHRKPEGRHVGNWGAVCPVMAVPTGIGATLKWKGKVQPEQGGIQVLWQCKSMSLFYKLKLLAFFKPLLELLCLAPVGGSRAHQFPSDIPFYLVTGVNLKEEHPVRL